MTYPFLNRPEDDNADEHLTVKNWRNFRSLDVPEFTSPYTTAQRPLFEPVGSASGVKKHVAIGAGDALPSDAVVRELLPWLDRYLGIVNRSTGDHLVACVSDATSVAAPSKR